VLTELIYYLDVLLDQEGKGRHRVERVLNAEVSYVRYLIGWIAKKVRLHQPRCETLSLMVYEGT
jgi:hypothetical protein